MIVALIALSVSLSGSAYAVVSINGSQLKNRSVAAKKIKKHTLTGTEINLSKLGTVPQATHAAVAGLATTATHAATADQASNAASLGGMAPSAFVQGGGKLAFAHVVLPAGTASTPNELLNVPGFIDLTAFCLNSTTPATLNFSFKNISGGPVQAVRTELAQMPPALSAADTDSFQLLMNLSAGGGINEAFVTTIRFAAGTGASAKVAVMSIWLKPGDTACDVGAEAQSNG